jgi:hypothetical protein
VAQAEQLAREAVSIVKKTDGLNNHGDVILGLAAVLRLSDRRKEAVSTTEDALDLYTQKATRPRLARLASFCRNSGEHDRRASLTLP